ncbi:hypothetical protein, partial [Enterococcus avium]|uniref:hypothetical protein n=1 Tax=Enterococcus avium TaxID=33945 RepID=UPI000FA7E7CD
MEKSLENLSRSNKFVSDTHLTLPTIFYVYISAVAAAYKKKLVQLSNTHINTKPSHHLTSSLFAIEKMTTRDEER